MQVFKAKEKRSPLSQCWPKLCVQVFQTGVKRLTYHPGSWSTHPVVPVRTHSCLFLLLQVIHTEVKQPLSNSACWAGFWNRRAPAGSRSGHHVHWTSRCPSESPSLSSVGQRCAIIPTPGGRLESRCWLWLFALRSANTTGATADWLESPETHKVSAKLDDNGWRLSLFK